MKMLWCYDDEGVWGRHLYEAARNRKMPARMFTSPYEPNEGYVFAHMHHHPNVRARDKAVMAHLALNPGLTLIPDYRSSVVYDDKIEQCRHFAKWMPRTFVSRTASEARIVLGQMRYPFMSKSFDGAGSHNVRLIVDEDAARNEIRLAFGGDGIKCRYNQMQQDYLLWQEFIPGNDHDIRAIIIGEQVMLLRRDNRDDRPMASGSGRTIPITYKNLDAHYCSALDFSRRFFKENSLKWCGIDLVAHGDRWYVLETTVGWTMPVYNDCTFFGPGDVYASTPYTGKQTWSVLLDEIQRGIFK